MNERGFLRWRDVESGRETVLLLTRSDFLQSPSRELRMKYGIDYNCLQQTNSESLRITRSVR